MTREHNTDGGDGSIDRDTAAIHGLGEDKQRLRDLGRSDAFIDALVARAESPIAFARTVAETVKFEREHDKEPSGD